MPFSHMTVWIMLINYQHCTTWQWRSSCVVVHLASQSDIWIWNRQADGMTYIELDFADGWDVLALAIVNPISVSNLFWYWFYCSDALPKGWHVQRLLQRRLLAYWQAQDTTTLMMAMLYLQRTVMSIWIPLHRLLRSLMSRSVPPSPSLISDSLFSAIPNSGLIVSCLHSSSRFTITVPHGLHSLKTISLLYFLRLLTSPVSRYRTPYHLLRLIVFCSQLGLLV